MNNEKFLTVLKEAFYKYLDTGSRSNQKLKILHGAIASDLKKRLSDDYIVHSLGYGDSREVNMKGRYMDKKVDIAIEKDEKIISAIALKFIMRNYSQNSNNYFENMLGETANIRSDGKPYFQIFIIPSQIPYFKKNGDLDHIEIITEHNLNKYIKLSYDNIEECLQTPNKTLIYIIDFPGIVLANIKNIDDYILYYENNHDFKISEHSKKYDFGDGVVYNNYVKFIETIVAKINSIK